MKNRSLNTRRQFLRNTSLATLGMGLSSTNAIAKTVTKHRTSEALNMCNPTTLDLFGEGPFYTENPPIIEENQLASSTIVGERMIISGRVYNLDCSRFIPDTIIDVWHANRDGAYDNSGYRLRGQTKTNSQGFYLFETIKPGHYLNGSTFRPAHIHFKITAPNQPTLITQLYFEGDEYIASDPAASRTNGQYDATDRIIPLSANDNGVLEGTWDIMIAGEGISSVQDMHLDKGMIYTAFPNPFSTEVLINYGVFRRSKVSLLVHDMQGKLVAKLEEKELAPEKYEAVWRPDTSLPNGYYFVVLKVNDLQVHYLKVMRQH